MNPKIPLDLDSPSRYRFCRSKEDSEHEDDFVFELDPFTAAAFDWWMATHTWSSLNA